MLLPDARPAAVVELPHLALDGRAGRHLRAPAVVADEDRLVAVFEVERRRLLEVAPPREEADVAHRLDERLGVVEHRLVLETGEPPVGEASRRPDLDELHLVAVFPAAVREPPLDVGGPRDQRLAIPEPDGLAQPAA